MSSVLLQIFAMIGLGVIWAILRPGGLEIRAVRNVLTNVVYYLFLPALIIDILWRAPLNLDSLRISISAAAAILASLALAYLSCRLCRINRAVTGTMLLAAAFPNATYLGLPLLEQTFGPWARSVVIQFDMFACFPLVLTVGFMIAAHYGTQGSKTNPVLGLLKVFPIWASVAGVLLNVFDVPSTTWIDGLLKSLSSVVIPLMLFSVGLALGPGLREWRHLPAVIPVAIIQLFFMPLFIWGFASMIGVSGQTLHALVVEAALPSMALGIVLADRYGLNTGVYAAALVLTTLLSFITLPLWYSWAS